jgi:large subunit ribosomal protein L18
VLSRKRVARAKSSKTVLSKVRPENGRHRLLVYRSSKHMYAQIFSLDRTSVIVSASSLDLEVAEILVKALNDDSISGKRAVATVVGKVLAERALRSGLTKVFFDRGSYIYHGRVKALADAARGAGLVF